MSLKSPMKTTALWAGVSGMQKKLLRFKIKNIEKAGLKNLCKILAVLGLFHGGAAAAISPQQCQRYAYYREALMLQGDFEMLRQSSLNVGDWIEFVSGGHSVSELQSFLRSRNVLLRPTGLSEHHGISMHGPDYHALLMRQSHFLEALRFPRFETWRPQDALDTSQIQAELCGVSPEDRQQLVRCFLGYLTPNHPSRSNASMIAEVLRTLNEEQRYATGALSANSAAASRLTPQVREYAQAWNQRTGALRESLRVGFDKAHHEEECRQPPGGPGASAPAVASTVATPAATPTAEENEPPRVAQDPAGQPRSRMRSAVGASEALVNLPVVPVQAPALSPGAVGVGATH